MVHMDSDIKQPPAEPTNASSGQTMDVIAPPQTVVSENAPPAPAPAVSPSEIAEDPAEPPQTSPQEDPVAKQPSEDIVANEPAEPVEKAAPAATPKQSRNLPIGAIVGAVVVFVVLAALAYLAYSKK